jgi:multicomponent Na+:H+ antiporter subunit B
MWIFLPALAGFFALFALGVMGLPPFGHYRGPYGDIVNAISVPERHITDVVTAVNFDFRGFDTLGEEFILFSSVLGAALLLRLQLGEQRGPQGDQQTGRQVPHVSDAVRILAVALVGPVALFGAYTVTHGQITPGGGFQGGVIVATAPLLVYLAGEFGKLRRIAPHWLVEIVEAVGAGGYIIIGAIGYFSGGRFLGNVLPLGDPGKINSGGIVPLINLTVGLEVSAGFLLLLIIFLEETLSQQDPL